MGDAFLLGDCADRQSSLVLYPHGAPARPVAFAREIHQAIEERRRDHAPLDEAIRYLMSQPPKKQVARDSRLDFEDTPATSRCDTENLLVYVRRVRNNLFHGGKFSETWPDRIGDTRLMRASLVVLEGCLEVSDLVRTAYEK